MLLAVDIGNTSAKFAAFEGERIERTFRLRNDFASEPSVLARTLAEHSGGSYSASVVASVVPSVLAVYSQALEKVTGTPPLVADHSMDFGFEIDYEPITDCGIDRLLAAAAAIEKAGAPCIVCDFGTATTIDLVDADRIFRGGTISPGPRLLYRSLNDHTAKLPLLEPATPEGVLGNTTRDSITSGIYHGYSGYVDRIIELLRETAGGDAPVLATGGDTGLVAKASKHLDRIEPDLVLEGLANLYLNNA